MMVPRTLAIAVLLQLVCSVATLATPSASNEVQREVHHLKNVDDTLRLDYGGGCQPRHVHLSLGRTQNATHSSMTVSFSLSPVCVVDETVRGAVRVGEHIIEGDAAHDVKSYNTSRSDHNHYFSDLYYHIEIDGLRPDREYSYECLLLLQKKEEVSAAQQYLRQDRSSEVINNDDNDDHIIISSSGISIFHTPPAPGQWPSHDHTTIKFAILGDLATRETSRETIRHLDDEHGIDCILLPGDLSYANNHHRIWDQW
jgi:hypothetical protein